MSRKARDGFSLHSLLLVSSRANIAAPPCNIRLLYLIINISDKLNNQHLGNSGNLCIGFINFINIYISHTILAPCNPLRPL